uniref:Uncharacterized protein n=1 Tax=viral metagenome TaxID=1070528 RepID=A0A6C0EI34_9ZZZZ
MIQMKGWISNNNIKQNIRFPCKNIVTINMTFFTK